MLILPPEHHAQAQRPRGGGLRHWFVPVIGGLLVLALVAVTFFSLTSHQAKSANGCLNFEYATVVGAENVHECDAPARKLCADPKPANQAQGHIAGSRTPSSRLSRRTAAKPVCRITPPPRPKNQASLSKCLGTP